MSEAKEMREWDRVSWLCFFMPRFTKTRYTPEDFHPLRAQEKAERERRALAWIKEMEEILPAKLSENEKEKRWQAHLKEMSKAKEEK